MEAFANPMKNNTSIKSIAKVLQNQLCEVYSPEEAQSITSIILEEVLGITLTQWVMDPEISIEPTQEKQLQEVLRRAMQQEPIQYILGKAHFYGLDFRVGPEVLIPRPETEELVALILEEHLSTSGKSPLEVLDIGTGSGCIPIALAANLPKAHVHALDISTPALDLAKRNALHHQCHIDFFQCNILLETPLLPALDIIVSNPPYVLESEKAAMNNNVLLHEPHSALFVPNDDPLLFYERIAGLAAELLAPKGKLYFEINEKYALDTEAVLEKFKFRQIVTAKDIHGKDRIVIGQKS